MALYEITSNNLRPIKATTFDQTGLHERYDLQRLLKSQIDAIAPDIMVITEEFSDWEDSKRRIDLLGLDRDANLVVIELKKTEDGGHMELQALRYAAMISPLDFEKVVDIHEAYLLKNGKSDDAKLVILEFLKWTEPQLDSFAKDIRIILVSANFSRELTTAVMWLNERGLDIQCIRAIPYQDDDKILMDIQQLIPLPEASAYQVRLREKESKGRQERGERNIRRRRFWQSLLGLAATKTHLHANISPTDYHWIGASAGLSGLSYNYIVRQHGFTAELYFGKKDALANRKLFDHVLSHKDQVETVFGEPLSWERPEGAIGCKVAYYKEEGGYEDSEDEWPRIQDAMVNAMVRLEKATASLVGELKRDGI